MDTSTGQRAPGSRSRRRVLAAALTVSVLGGAGAVAAEAATSAAARPTAHPERSVTVAARPLGTAPRVARPEAPGSASRARPVAPRAAPRTHPTLTRPVVARPLVAARVRSTAPVRVVVIRGRSSGANRRIVRPAATVRRIARTSVVRACPSHPGRTPAITLTGPADGSRHGIRHPARLSRKLVGTTTLSCRR